MATKKKQKVEILEKDKIIKSLIGDDKTLAEHLSKAHYTSQAEAVLHMLAGHNVFLSGPAGSGKSWVIQKFQELYPLFKPKKRLHLTSTTGLSAINIGGKTIHSWSGMGISPLTFEEDKTNPPDLWKYTHDRIDFASCLIIDEISMLSARQFEYVMKRIRDVRKFKKLQIIVSGDFTQLPPVEGMYCYDTEEWNNCNFVNLYLDRNYRARNDKELAKVLEEISIGNGYDEKIFSRVQNIKSLNERSNKPIMRLFSTNKAADTVNKEKQARNIGKLYENVTKYGVDNMPIECAAKADVKYAESCYVEPTLQLKVGDTVMVTNNQNNAIHIQEEFEEDHKVMLPQNGSIGRFFIHDGFWAIELDNGDKFFFAEPVEHALVKRKWKKAKTVDELEMAINGKVLQEEVVASFKQYPLKLAYAITMHKSQGQTFSNVAVDLAKCWCENLGYVALSRAQTFDGLRLVVPQGAEEKLNSVALAINNKSIDIKKQLIQKALQARESTLFTTLEKINKNLDEDILLEDLFEEEI